MNVKYKVLLGILGIIIVGILFYLYWTYERTFTIIYDSQGGTWIESVEVRINDKVPIPEEPRYAGYVFQGWYLDDKPYDFDSLVTHEFTLVARWEKVENE